MTLTHIAERLAVELSLSVLTTKVCRGWDSAPNLPQASRTLYPTDLFVLKFCLLAVDFI